MALLSDIVTNMKDIRRSNTNFINSMKSKKYEKQTALEAAPRYRATILIRKGN